MRVLLPIRPIHLPTSEAEALRIYSALEYKLRARARVMTLAIVASMYPSYQSKMSQVLQKTWRKAFVFLLLYRFSLRVE
jgi:hypothetical protein